MDAYIILLKGSQNGILTHMKLFFFGTKNIKVWFTRIHNKLYLCLKTWKKLSIKMDLTGHGVALQLLNLLKVVWRLLIP